VRNLRDNPGDFRGFTGENNPSRRNEYLVAENRILKAQSQGRLRLSDAERATLGEISHRLGRKALGDVATAARPDTLSLRGGPHLFAFPEESEAGGKCPSF